MVLLVIRGGLVHGLEQIASRKQVAFGVDVAPVFHFVVGEVGDRLTEQVTTGF